MDLTEGPVVSVVIPAHNEEAGLAGLLARLLDGAVPGEFDVVVVANACTDRTAGVARDAGVRVVETETPGKANALRLGDESARVFPRVYADADVLLSADGVRALVEAVQKPGVLACAPRPVLDLSGAGPVARRVHRVHEALVAPSRGLAGTGVYVLTEDGHARVFPLPDGLLADDGWVHASFGQDERAVVAEAASVVRPARTVRAHLRRRVRVRLGNRQLAELGRPVTANPLRLPDLLGLVRVRRVGAVEAACYLAVLALDKALARVRRDRPVSWGTDASSRHS
ncbi:glycosyltransferase [Actinomadura harenae]|uniref:4,4'-diaponeurosporenoate glycosyltransferase n=1 Tax=Actinomadura harenae TaxID=2483351 RepID=A0A3M2M2X2_9ACTN|nr:glycosyltransferase [Actinomadura harenae]RMI41468.1 glycosyltransferase [Actinomadura harenae]